VSVLFEVWRLTERIGYARRLSKERVSWEPVVDGGTERKRKMVKMVKFGGGHFELKEFIDLPRIVVDANFKAPLDMYLTDPRSWAR
jgi:hypothetical protein